MSPFLTFVFGGNFVVSEVLLKLYKIFCFLEAIETSIKANRRLAKINSILKLQIFVIFCDTKKLHLILERLNKIPLLSAPTR